MLAGAFTAYCYQSESESFLCNTGSIYTINIFTGLLIEFGASTLWMSQASYVNDCTNETNKGTYHGIFLSVMTFASVIGNTMAAFVLRETDILTFYLSLSCLACISSIMLAFLPRFPKNDTIVVTEQK